ncbi:hypothetical protein L6164_032949 [Bauhinia variegata]|uniref:Uncharacterized protein n=1 Tax=Bauhinia variegata TaxID=167791 RepID=A0ACB9KQC7_BAUVA|nr:hypothetical protein L6164_032949 [Bauhinia variegata]
MPMGHTAHLLLLEILSALQVFKGLAWGLQEVQFQSVKLAGLLNLAHSFTPCFDLHHGFFLWLPAQLTENSLPRFNWEMAWLMRLCSENSLDNNLVNGKIVLCDNFLDTTGLLSGAAGVLVANTDPKDVAFSYALPTTPLSLKDNILIQSYVNSTSNPTATILKSNVLYDSSAPYIMSLSSIGPNPFAPNILKPDLAAPGVDILAAWSPLGSPSAFTGDKRAVHYNIMFGTSMSSPHAAGAAAYVKSFHPNWSSAAIKCALMTTATPMSPILNPEAEFAYCAGHIDLVKAVNPGLVYDASEDDYLKFMCGQGYNARKLQTVSGDSSSCSSKGKNGTVWDVNQPSFALSATISTSIGPVVYRRTVTNVGSATSTYKAQVIASHLLNFEVNPSVLSFTDMGQKKSFTATIEGTINVPIVSAALVWDDGSVQVRSPIVV